MQKDPIKQAAGRLGAYALHSRHDSKVTSRPGRDAFLKKFEDAVDPLGQLDPAERARRAAFARKDYFTRLVRRRWDRSG